MKAPNFIARKIRFSSLAAAVSIAVSFVVMIVAIAVAGGFRSEIYSSLCEAMGDVCVTAISSPNDRAPISGASHFVEHIKAVDGVSNAREVVSQMGIVKQGDDIQGVLFKASKMEGANPMDVCIPAKLASTLGLEVGDRMLAYFVTDRAVVRNLNVAKIYDGIVADSNNMLVLCDIYMLRRVLGYEQDEATMIEVTLEKSRRGNWESEFVAQEISSMLYTLSAEDHSPLLATSVRQKYSQLFSWLDLIDFNVNFIIILMMLVAGINMIGGLLIMLFQNIRTIGMLKTMGMENRLVARTFLLSAGSSVLKAEFWGNVVALALCALQYFFHIIKLNPDTYFVSFVPVQFNLLGIIAIDIVAFVVIMLIQLIPCAFISRVEAAKTVACR